MTKLIKLLVLPILLITAALTSCGPKYTTLISGSWDSLVECYVRIDEHAVNIDTGEPVVIPYYARIVDGDKAKRLIERGVAEKFDANATAALILGLDKAACNVLGIYENETEYKVTYAYKKDSTKLSLDVVYSKVKYTISYQLVK